MILTTPDVNVVLMDFPSKKGNEMVVPNEDGSYTILINAGLNYESQLKAYEHAMSHITNDDFLKGKKIEVSSDIYEKLNINPETKIKKNYIDYYSMLCMMAHNILIMI